MSLCARGSLSRWLKGHVADELNNIQVFPTHYNTTNLDNLHREKLHLAPGQSSFIACCHVRALVMKPCRSTRCWLTRGDSSPRPSPRSSLRARAAGFHCSCHSLPARSFTLPVLSLCRLSLRLSFCVFVGRASSLG